VAEDESEQEPLSPVISNASQPVNLQRVNHTLTSTWSVPLSLIRTWFVPLPVCDHSQGIYFLPNTGGRPPKNGLIALWPSTNGANPYFLVLPGSELSITEITEYTYFSP